MIGVYGSGESPCVYRLFDSAGALLYIGVSMTVMNRMYQQTKYPWFREIATVTLEHMECREDAYRAETAAIKREKPKYNLVHNGKIDYQARAENRRRQKAEAEAARLASAEKRRLAAEKGWEKRRSAASNKEQSK